MSAQPSAGPWQTKHDFDLEGQLTIIANVDGEYHDGVPHCTYDVIAVCMDEHGESLPNALANARLIAAAREMASFIGMIARMTQDGENLADAIFFTMTPEDAIATVNRLIEEARKIEKKAGLA